MDSPIGALHNGDLDASRAAMADRVAQALLDHTVYRLLEMTADPILLDGNRRVYNDIRTSAAPECHEAIDRSLQANGLEWPQASENRADVALHPADRVVNGVGMRRNLRLAVTAGQPLDGRGRHVDGKQQRPDFVVQIAGEIGAFLRL